MFKIIDMIGKEEESAQ